MLSGLILTGGESSRMGTDKAAVEFSGEPQLERLWRLLSGQLDSVYVSLRSGQSEDALRAKYPYIADTLADIGPAAGILAAHAYNPRSAWLTVACDMPLVSPELLQQLIAGRKSESLATVFVDGSGAPEPLIAIYEPAGLAGLQTVVDNGSYAGPRKYLAELIEQDSVTVLEPAEVDQLQGFNTPQEMEMLLPKHKEH